MLARTLATVAALAAAAPAMAGLVELDSFTNGFPADTRPLGSAVADSFSIDGINTTVKLTTTETPVGQTFPSNAEKVAPFFYAGTLGQPIGTLGNLTGLTLDWRLQSRGATTPSFVGNVAAIRIRVDGPNPGTFAELVWETGYQDGIGAFTAGSNYNDLDIGSGKFWARYNSQNYGQGENGPVNALTLSQLAAGGALTPAAGSPIFGANTNVYGLQVSIGSDAGDYVAYVGDINANFVPEPASFALIALGGAAMLKRTRKA